MKEKEVGENVNGKSEPIRFLIDLSNAEVLFSA